MKTLIYASYLNSPSKIPLIEYNLKQLQPFFDSVIIVYSSIDEENILLPTGFCGLSENEIFLIPNIGYDFAKYKFGLQKTQQNPTSHTAIINDSVSVIKPLEKIFEKIDLLINEGFENIGILGSDEIKPHYQSWCWILGKKAQDFCIKNINTNLPNKGHVIVNNEVEISNKMISNFKSCSLFSSALNLFYRNPNLTGYIEKGFPFIKNNAFNDRFLKAHGLQFNKALTDSKYVNEIVLNLIKKYYGFAK